MSQAPTIPDFVDEANRMLGRMAGDEAQRRVREQIKNTPPGELNVWDLMDRLVIAENAVNPKGTTK